MIFRIAQTLGKKIKVAPAEIVPPDPNPFADWSARLFTADRKQFVILTNTHSLYSVVMPGRGVASGAAFSDRAVECIEEFTATDGLEFIYRRFVEPDTETIRFSKALNRSVTGSMNDLVYHAQVWLIELGLSTLAVSFRLNEMPMSAINYRFPREVFTSQLG